VLADEARGIFQGKVIVRPDAQKSDGKQMAKALLLSPDAEFDSKPELEIYADDVVCGHGATVAEMDEDHVFYLMARGIPEAQARALLTEAFAAEVVDAIAHEAIREAMRARLAAWLAAG
jgi:Fe-S cluster assembly protein SufD